MQSTGLGNVVLEFNIQNSLQLLVCNRQGRGESVKRAHEYRVSPKHTHESRVVGIAPGQHTRAATKGMTHGLRVRWVWAHWVRHRIVFD